MTARDRHGQWRSAHSRSVTAGLNDPFTVNPIRRSFGLVMACVAVLGLPWLINDKVGTTVMLIFGWLAVTGIVMGLPILLWSLAEEGIAAIRRRTHPSIEFLNLSPRVEHILHRHGLRTIHDVENSSDVSLLLLSNMDQRGLREIRRAVTLWKYRRWQESGFAASGDD
jgi:hypothetical protein